MGRRKTKGGYFSENADFSQSGMTDSEIAQLIALEESNPNLTPWKESTPSKQYDVSPVHNPAYEPSAPLSDTDNLPPMKIDYTPPVKQPPPKIIYKPAYDPYENYYKNKSAQLENQLAYEKSKYNSLFNWSAGLIPSYYTMAEREKIKQDILKTLNSELKKNSPEYELKDTIKKLVSKKVNGIVVKKPKKKSKKIAKKKSKKKKSVKKKSKKKKSVKKKSKKKVRK